MLTYLLERPSSTDEPVAINLYARSPSKIPEAQRSSPNVQCFDGAVSSTSLKPCLRDVDVIFQCIATNISEPGCSIAQQAAHAIVEALEAIRAESGANKFRSPVVVFLSSASLNPRFSAEVPRLMRWILGTALFYVYDDLRKALAYLREEAPWIPLIEAQPPALVKDVVRGFELREPRVEGPTPFLSYEDLARAMVNMVEADQDGKKWIGKSVGICGVTKDVKADVLPLIKYNIIGLIGYFFPSLWRMGNGRLW